MDYCVYKTPNTPNMVFENALKRLIGDSPQNSFISIIGDFNFNMLDTKTNNPLRILLTNKFQNKLGDLSTFDSGNQIDVVLSNSSSGYGGVRSSYFSDHSAIFYQTIIDEGQLIAPILEYRPPEDPKEKKKKQQALKKESKAAAQTKLPTKIPTFRKENQKL